MKSSTMRNSNIFFRLHATIFHENLFSILRVQWPFVSLPMANPREINIFYSELARNRNQFIQKSKAISL